MRKILLAALLIMIVACGNTSPVRPESRTREPVIGLPCEGCETVFDGLPDHPASRARVAPVSEPGEPLTITGHVYGPDGSPRAGVIVYAYQTDASGVYPPAEASHRHGRLRGWVMSDEEGTYTFDTIRPGSYPGRTDPAHVHLHVIEPGCATYYIDDLVFTDDPLLTPAAQKQTSRGRGGKGIATPTRANNRWHVVRDVHLGMNIPGYTACSTADRTTGGTILSAHLEGRLP